MTTMSALLLSRTQRVFDVLENGNVEQSRVTDRRNG